MHRFKNILVCMGHDVPEPAVLNRVASLARSNGGAVTLLSVVEPFPWYTRFLLAGSEELQEVIARERAGRFEAVASALRTSGLEVATEVRTGRLPIEAIREVLKGKCDLVVKQAEPDRGMHFGSVDMHLLRACPCPVWMFRPSQPDRPLERILVAVDPAPAPDAADVLHLRAETAAEEEALNTTLLELGISLSELDGGELHVVHAWSAPGEDLLSGDINLSQEQVRQYVESLREEAAKALERLLARFWFSDRPGRRQVHLLKGAAADVISELARSERVDLVVMGTVARTGIPGLLIGNTAETILHQVECSVLAVKPEGFVSPVTPDAG